MTDTFPQITEALPFSLEKISEVLDPEFCGELCAMTKNFSDNQYNADSDKWNIARLVNDMWQEHKSHFETKLDYLAECSRVANTGLRHKRFSDSGETLRRWCEVQATYAAFAEKVEDADKFLDLLSFDHLRQAKKLYLNGKVKSPFLALSTALVQKYTADEMQYHFDPPTVPDEWEVMRDRVQAMKSKDFWKMKHPQNIKRVIEHVNEIEKILMEDRQ
jgi:Fic family protein